MAGRSPAKDAKEYVGKALYLEFLSPGRGRAFQLILMPEAVVDNRLVNFSFYRRQVDPDSRSVWRFSRSTSQHQYSDAIVPMPPAEIPSVDAALDSDNETMNRLTKLFFVTNQLASSGWILAAKPFAVDVTLEDMRSAANGKTPYKVLNRILRGRKELNYPTTVIE